MGYKLLEGIFEKTYAPEAKEYFGRHFWLFLLPPIGMSCPIFRKRSVIRYFELPDWGNEVYMFSAISFTRWCKLKARKESVIMRWAFYYLGYPIIAAPANFPFYIWYGWCQISMLESIARGYGTGVRKVEKGESENHVPSSQPKLLLGTGIGWIDSFYIILPESLSPLGKCFSRVMRRYHCWRCFSDFYQKW